MVDGHGRPLSTLTYIGNLICAPSANDFSVLWPMSQPVTMFENVIFDTYGNSYTRRQLKRHPGHLSMA